MSKVYITTAIPYVNGAPHIGHAMDYLLADVLARYQKQQGHTVKFQVGTDEHGNKIFQKSKELGLDVHDYIKANTKKFKDFIQELGVEYTDFIHTTDEDHERRCQLIWEKLSDHIYKNQYEGWYCEGCERFVTAKECEENHGVCPDHNKEYQKLAEENYYLRISDFKDQIIKAIESGELQVLPDFRKKEILKLIADTPDVSISRPKKQLSWGIPVPGDDSQVMYVWLDALANYITLLGYPENDISEFWPAYAQFVGKDILRFHTIIWPAMLLGLGLPLPKTILSHGFVLANGSKMSKSIGNVVDPLEVLHRHGLPAFRYYFLRHVDTFADSDFTWEKFEAAYSGELANDLGNLVQRLSNLCKKQALPGLKDFTPQEDETYHNFMEEKYFSKAFDHVWSNVQAINKLIDDKKPWTLKAEDQKDELISILNDLSAKLLQVAYLLEPFIPETAAKITEIFTADHITPPATPLFPKD